jgi:hypothetical protein
VVRIQIGEVVIKTDQDLTPRQLHALIGKATTVALLIQAPTEEAERPLVSLGFTSELAIVEEPDLSEYFEEERVRLD